MLGVGGILAAMMVVIGTVEEGREEAGGKTKCCTYKDKFDPTLV